MLDYPVPNRGRSRVGGSFFPTLVHANQDFRKCRGCGTGTATGPSGFGRDEVAVRFGMVPRTVSRILTGHRMPRLCEVLGRARGGWGGVGKAGGRNKWGVLGKRPGSVTNETAPVGWCMWM